MKRILTIILILTILLSCKSDDESSDTSKTEIDLVTGINIIDEFGTPIETYGNPNVFIDGQVFVFPNPVSDLLSISANNEITDYWLVAGNEQKIFQDTDFNAILNGDTYSSSQLDNIAVQQSQNQINSTNLLVNMESLDEGYFKIFVKINDKIYWNNIYHGDGQASTLNEIINFWN